MYDCAYKNNWIIIQSYRALWFNQRRNIKLGRDKISIVIEMKAARARLRCHNGRCAFRSTMAILHLSSLETVDSNTFIVRFIGTDGNGSIHNEVNKRFAFMLLFLLCINICRSISMILLAQRICLVILELLYQYSWR